MSSLPVFVAIYVFGGITFIPLLLVLLFFYAYLTLPLRSDPIDEDIGQLLDEGVPPRPQERSHADSNGFPAELKPPTHIPDVAAGYFAVCREYVPGGINGKPPERITPAGTVVATESPSVYQSMYRSIFDRNKTTSPTLDVTIGRVKKARNVFYVVLRHGHLMLYDDSEQLEVRHVISLAHYEVGVYGGGETIPEGELWIKRNCIQLKQRLLLGSLTADSKPFYFFSENCSEKEDFYHAMLQSQEHGVGSCRTPPLPLQFHTPDLVKLVQQLHASEENLQTRWINALIGRLFLSLYKTSTVEQLIRTKITKKIARVPKPALITGISLQKIDMGDLPPFITNPKLRELTVDGDLTVEADVSYKGNFRLEVSAIARIELGSRFKAREVTLVLAGILKRLEGHVLVRIKPPPSNRLWVTFESTPKMEMTLEPIVSSRQITYGVILRAIESRIREVINETLVLPNWDDIPFSDTALHQFRGGIWKEGENTAVSSEHPGRDYEHETVYDGKESDSEDSDPQPPILSSSESVQSMPILSEATFKSRGHMDVKLDSSDLQESIGMSSSTDFRSNTRPKAMRPGSFSSVATPVVNMNTASAAAAKGEVRKRQQDAATTMKSIAKSQPTSPTESPVGSPPQPTLIFDPEARMSSNATLGVSREDGQDEDLVEVSTRRVLPISVSSSGSGMSKDSSRNPSYLGFENGQSLSLPRNAFTSLDKKQTFNQSLNSATTAARKWFASRQNQDSSSTTFNTASARPQVSTLHRSGPGHDTEGLNQAFGRTSTPPMLSQSSPESQNLSLGFPTHPIGRGQPLPPPGTPLPPPPRPDKRNTVWTVPGAASLANLARRKPLPINVSQSVVEQAGPPDSLSLSASPAEPHLGKGDHPVTQKVMKGPRRKSSSMSTQSAVAPPLPPRRQRLSASDNMDDCFTGLQEDLLVVKAPSADKSAPTSPLEESQPIESNEHELAFHD
ncbi:uncharacterized protein BDR25DRAFT_339253 [Lindgomyces ingoldianus]|uniref:Uncharacterized protein n=1 Tax=Lindgomyces ingoldianus TaxID=673940 RepID=A0ACB6RG77_9PLEO|nr:uncharacterized protein BDR25DRAFT_339253 [Lindgomyces ingoldianus]KAF2477307.1 hypothetical protein BDR25DRAFT_339253 [Lindgomyces ingoldianus]